MSRCRGICHTKQSNRLYGLLNLLPSKMSVSISSGVNRVQHSQVGRVLFESEGDTCDRCLQEGDNGSSGLVPVWCLGVVGGCTYSVVCSILEKGLLGRRIERPGLPMRAQQAAVGPADHPRARPRVVERPRLGTWRGVPGVRPGGCGTALAPGTLRLSRCEGLATIISPAAAAPTRFAPHWHRLCHHL